MGFNNSNTAAEGSIANAFNNSVVVAIADFMDDGSGYGRKDMRATKSTTQQPPHSKSVETSDSVFCSPYNQLFWIGGDCMRKSASSSLAIITECATMKTDNTSDASTASPSKDVPAAVSPCSSNCSTNTSTDNSANERNIAVIEDQNQTPSNQITNDSISSSNINTNANVDIISQYNKNSHTAGESANWYKNEKSLFTDYGDYDDPLNSILVEDHTDASKNSRNTHESKVSHKNRMHSNFIDKYNRVSNNSLVCDNTNTVPEEEEEVWFSASALAASSWCGAYSSMLIYNAESDAYKKVEHDKRKEEPPDYYAEFKPQRQYAFDEEDFSESTSSPPALVDSDNSQAATASDGNSVLTSSSSIQSFNVITHPHKHKTLHSKRQLEKPPFSHRITPEKDQHRHLHRFMENPVPNQIKGMNNDSDSDGNPFDYVLTQSLMRKLQKHLPNGKRGDSFWLQYSLIRDGASLDSLIQMVHSDASITSNNICSVLAIETVEGEVFGAFLTQTWRRSPGHWYGGGQSFLWTTSFETKPSKRSSSKRQKDSNLRIFPYSFENSYVQLCDRDRLLVGGGDGGSNYERHCYGFGLALERDLLTGSSCPCTTFQSPSLSKLHADGSTFEIRNLEVWRLTPSLTVIDNPSQGLVRVHNTDNKRKTKKERPGRSKATANATTNRGATRNVAKNDQSCQDFYNCSAPPCQDIDVDEIHVNHDLGARSFPGPRGDVVRNRNTRRHNCQRRKNRNKYLSLNASM